MNGLQFIGNWLVPTCYATTDVYYVSEVVSHFGDFFTSTSAVLEGVLPDILGLVGVLIGLAVAIRYVKRWIGRR